MSYLLFEEFSASNIFNFPTFDYSNMNPNSEEFYPGMFLNDYYDYEEVWWSMNKSLFEESYEKEKNNYIYFGSIKIDLI
jgi:hypothetical protein